MSFLATLFVEKTGFLFTFFQIQNLGRGYTDPFWSKIEDVLFFLHIFEDIFTKNHYFENNLIEAC